MGVHRRRLPRGRGHRPGHRSQAPPEDRPEPGFEGPRTTARTLLKEGDVRFVALSWSDHPGPDDYDEAYDRLVWTAHHWQNWLARGTFPDHPWRSYLERSALTLKGLTYSPTGALIAAATTSLPETPNGERNWDYRYSWIRDSTFTLWGLYTLGFDWEANDFFYFIADVAADTDKLQIMYGVAGEKQLDEEILHHLHGYEGASPVRIGNGAYDQRQNDVWGTVLDSFYLHTKSRDGMPEEIWPILKRQVDAALEHWRETDHGMWEVRGEPQALHFVEGDVLGRGRPGRPAGPAPRGLRPGRGMAARCRRDPRRHLRERGRRTRRLHPALRDRCPRRLLPAAAAAALPAGVATPDPGHGAWRSPTS